MTIEEIKEECAKDFGFKNYSEIEALDCESMVIDELAQRYAQSQTQELTNWKESMMKVHNELDLQGIGHALGLPLGSPIAPQVLPKIIGLIEQNAELIDLLKGIVKQIEKGEKIGGINLLTTSSIEYEYAQKLLTKYNHLNQM